MEINIRHETENEFEAVENIARDAFYNLYFPGAHEHYLISKLRNHKDYIKELSFIIEVDGKIAGAIFFARSTIRRLNQNYEVVSLGPFFISPAYHRKGLGRSLITHAINKAKNLGYRAIITLGYPYHYNCYGFTSSKKFGIYSEDGNYYVGLLVLPLYEGALNGISGIALFSDVYDFDVKEADEYDLKFPSKVKKHQSSQDEYERTASLVDTNEYY